MMPASEGLPHLHVLLLADDFGVDLWPLVRRLSPACLAPADPKQTDTLLSALARRAKRFSPYPLHVATVEDMAAPISSELAGHAGLAADEVDLIVMPLCIKSAFTVALACACIRRKDPDAVVLAIPANQRLSDDERWEGLVYRAYQTALRDRIVLIAADEEHCASGTDYLKVGRPYSNIEGSLEVRSLVCGASSSAAQRAVRDGALWYTGMFTARAATLLGALANAPSSSEGPNSEDIGRIAETAAFFAEIDESAWHSEDAELIIETLPAASIEQAAFGDVTRLVALPAGLRISLFRSLEDLSISGVPDRFGNRCIGPAVDVGSTNTTAVEQEHARLVCTCGLEDALVIDMADMVLVADKRAAKNLSPLVERMQAAQVAQLDAPARRTFPWGVATLVFSADAGAAWWLEVRPSASLDAMSIPRVYRAFDDAGDDGDDGAGAGFGHDGGSQAGSGHGRGEGRGGFSEMYSVVTGYVEIVDAASGTELDLMGPGECFSAGAGQPVRIRAYDEGPVTLVLTAAAAV